jgi:hypothetical protein
MTKKKLQLDLIETVALLSNLGFALVPIFLNKSVREQAFYAVFHGVIYFVSLYLLLAKYGFAGKVKVHFILLSALLLWSLVLLYVSIGMVEKFN